MVTGMLLCKVIGCVISTCKDENIKGKKLMVVQEECNPGTDKSLIAVDCVDAGIGDTVMVLHEGGSSRMASQCSEGPVDAAIVGVVDHE
jgi:Carbon dioxide concentrating mechanism/carboxysome shell protein